MLRRIIAAFFALAFGQGVNILIQLVSLPAFLLHWDASTYGSWLTLSALPAYLSVADVGMVNASGNKMTMAMGRHDVEEANNIFQTAQLFMMTTCCSVGLIIIPFVLLGPLPKFISMDQRIALSALICEVLLAMFGGLYEQIFKATGRNATAILLGNIIRISQFSGSIAGLILIGTFSAVAVPILLVRIVGISVGMIYSQRVGRGIAWGTRHASKAEFLTIIRPAVSFMAFPLANALSFQGVTLMVGALFGMTSVAIFNTYRTIARIAVQMTSMFSFALWPEFAQLFGKGGAGAIESLFRRSALLGAIQAAGLSLVLYFLSPWLLRIWTHGRIGFEPHLMGWLLLYAAVGGVAHVPRVMLMSTNQHISLAGWSIAAGGLAVTLGWAFGTLWQISGVGAAMLVSESVITSLCLYLAYRLLSAPRTLREDGL